MKAWKSHPLWARACSVLLLTLLAMTAIGSLVFPDTGYVLGPIGLIVGGISSGTTFIVVGRRLEGRERLSWTLIGAALIVAAVGALAFSILALVSQVAAFGPPDLLVLTGFFVGILGIVLLPQVAVDWSQSVRVVLDGLIAAVSIGVIAWLLVLGDLIGELQHFSGWSRLAGSAYPILDMVTIAAVIMVLLRRSTYRFDIRLLFVGLAFVAQSIADVAYLRDGVGRSFQDAHPIFALNIAAQAFFFLAALFLTVRPKRRELADRKAPLAALLAPYALAAVLVGLFVIYALLHRVDSDFWALLYGALLVAALTIARQAVSIRENRILVEREREALVSSISHELRTPLTAIVGFLDLVVDTGTVEAEERDELLQVVHQQAGYMARIVSDLVLLARGSFERVDLSPTRIPLQRLVIEGLSGVDRAGTSVSVEVDDEAVVYVDSERIQQVIVNLTLNAIRYGGGRVDVVARVEDGTVIIEVHDDGPGVPTKYEFTIWEQFERGAHRLDATRPGSGIGLAIVRAIARAHGGRTGYSRSDRLGGACFSVVLPRRADGSKTPEPAGSGVLPA